MIKAIYKAIPNFNKIKYPIKSAINEANVPGAIITFPIGYTSAIFAKMK